SRGKAATQAGETVAWFLQHGEYLRQNDVLKTECGQFVQVVAAEEPVSKVTTDHPFLLTRAAYHLGNRHVPLQVKRTSLLYQSDHVLDDMVRGLGLTVEPAQSAFQPEDGAYYSHGH
ncbi:uncharacterized protein METZ01_LOCUS487803, partial [marine metagenome]